MNGVNTFYRLRQTTELSPGAPQRYLARLEQLGLVRRPKEAAARNRREFHATPKGRAALRRAWQAAAARADQTDFISVVRVAAVGCFINPDEGSDFLERVADKRAGLAVEQRSLATNPPGPGADLLKVYRWLRAVSLAQQYEAEAQTFKEVAVRIRSQSTAASVAECDGGTEQKEGGQLD